MENYLEYGNEGVDCKGVKWTRTDLNAWTKDNTGKQFDRLTALFRVKVENQKDKAARWLCLCSCGNLVVEPNRYLQGGSVKSCGCKFYDAHHTRAEDLTGQKFERVTVLRRDYNYKDEHNLKTQNVYWTCQCECGNIFVTTTQALKTGHTQSCGCNKVKRMKELNFKDLTGQRFGKLIAKRVSPRPAGHHGMLYWYCDCDCGAKDVEVLGESLRNGITESCGCLRSKGEQKISQLLSENNINFKREYSPKNFILSTGGIPRFDFAILNSDGSIAYLLEYQGSQHYLTEGRGYFTDEEVEKIHIRDKEKKEYCENNNIPLIYIKYTEYEKLNINSIYFPELIH